MGFKSTRLGGKSLNGLGIEGLITDKEARQGDKQDMEPICLIFNAIIGVEDLRHSKFLKRYPYRYT